MHGVFILHLRRLLAAMFRNFTRFPFGLPPGDDEAAGVSPSCANQEANFQPVFDQLYRTLIPDITVTTR